MAIYLGERTISSARGEQDPTTEKRPVSDEYFGIKASRTMLYGYGGFGISQRPLFWPSLRIWIERGGIFVVAHIRGG